MRFVFIGTSKLSVSTAKRLVQRGHEVVMIEQERGRIETLQEELDCGFLHGDGSKPGILREAAPEDTDLLFCLTSNDQTNIISSLVGRSLGFHKAVTRIEDSDFEHICMELELYNFIVPARTIARHLADFAEGQNTVELSAMIKGDARLFLFVADSEEEGTIVHQLDLPPMARIISIYRDNEFVWPGRDTRLKDHDEVVIITHGKHLEALKKRWGGKAKTVRHHDHRPGASDQKIF
jgi:trk system potassium uptake protein TrkA